MTETQRVYKSGGKRLEYLITLDIDPSNENTNLNRSDVVDKNTAKFRCKEAFVVEIAHKETGELVESICSYFNTNFIYKVGSYIEEPSYDNNIDKVCLEDIHFFTTKETALFDYLPEKHNGPFKAWHENGQLKQECEYKNGVREGPFKEWYDNGQLWTECEYKNGVREGPYKKWYYNGQLWKEREYKNGELEGPYKFWYKNGQLGEEHVYKNGIQVCTIVGRIWISMGNYI